MSDIKISVAVPVYNVAPYISRCAESIFNQTFKQKVEYIFVDDACTDNSMDLLKKSIEKYQIHNIKIITHSQNRGLAAARNTALQHAEGEYIAVVDSDDYVEPDALETLYSKAYTENADIVISDIFIEKMNQTIIAREKECRTKSEYFNELISDKNLHGYIWSKLIRTELYKRSDCRVPEGLNYLEDRYVSIRLFYYAHKISHAGKALFHYVQYNSNSLTKSKKEAHFQNLLRFWADTDSFLKEKQVFSTFEKELSKQKIQNKARLMIDTASIDLRRKYAHIYMEFEDENLSFLRKGERLMLFLVRNRLFFFTKIFRNILSLKQKLRQSF